jgi:hypothetical protein
MMGDVFRLLPALALLAACGRLHFDDRGTGIDDGASDSRSAACSATAESCNGIDDDCNGAIDEGCPCTPFTTDITSEFSGNESPPLVWTGDGYLTTSVAGSTKSVVRLTASGTLAATTQLGPVASTKLDRSPSASAWNGAAMAIVWSTDSGPTGSVQLQRFDATAAPVGSPITIANLAFHGHVVWTGDRFLVVWTDGGTPAMLHVRELDAELATLAPDVLIDASSISSFDGVVATPSGFLAVYSDPGFETQVLVWDRASGAPTLHSMGMLTDMPSLHVVSSPSGYMVLGKTTGTGPWVHALDASGTPVGTTTKVPIPATTYSYGAIVTESPTSYRVIAQESAITKQIFEVFVDSAGAVTSGPTMIGTNNGNPFGEHSATRVSGRVADALVYAAGSELVTVRQRCE